jgi:uncharacterized protein
LTVFADSSALVKLYVAEVGHEAVRAIVDPIVIANLARVEVPAAFWGKTRTGELDVDDAALLVSAFEHDYHGDEEADSIFAVVSHNEPTLIDAARHAARHRLRAYDAVQLACAIAARRADPSIEAFAVFDKSLRNAAIAEGFAIVSSA